MGKKRSWKVQRSLTPGQILEKKLASLLESGSYAEAEPLFTQLVNSKPACEVGYENLVAFARLKLELKKPDEALHVCGLAIDLDEIKQGAPEVMVEAYIKLKLYSKALKVADRLIEHAPDFVTYRVHRLVALSHLRDSDKTLKAWEEILEESPEFATNPQLSYVIMNALIQDGRISEAKHEWDRIIQLCKDWNPYLALVEPNLQMNLGNYDSAIESLTNSAKKQPENRVWNWNRGLIHLGHGDLVQGWLDYESRWSWDDFPSPKRTIDLPIWDGTNLAGKKLIISAEQGLGDQLMFSVVIAQLLKQNPAKIRLEVQAKAVPLFQLWYPDCEVTDWKNDLNLDSELKQEFDFHAPMATVCRFLMYSRDAVQNLSRRKLRVSEKERSEMLGGFREKYPVLIGLSWRSSAIDGERVSGYMNVNFCEAVINALPDHIGFVIVQYKFAESERAILEKHPNVYIPDEDLFNDLVVNGKYCGCCDVVLSAPTVVAQLGGLFGVPVITWGTENSWVNLGFEHPPWFGSLFQIQHKPNMSKAAMVQKIIAILRKAIPIDALNQAESSHELIGDVR